MQALVYLHAQSKLDAVGDVQPVDGETGSKALSNAIYHVSRIRDQSVASDIYKPPHLIHSSVTFICDS